MGIILISGKLEKNIYNLLSEKKQISKTQVSVLLRSKTKAKSLMLQWLIYGLVTEDDYNIYFVEGVKVEKK